MSRLLDRWYSLPDLDLLADRGAVIEGELAIDRLPRLADLLSVAEGSVRARLRFRQRSGVCVILDLHCEARLELVCQRCLEPLAHSVDVDVSYGLLEEDNEPARAALTEGIESFALDGERFSPAQLIEDELIVSLPLVARHASRKECGRLAQKIDTMDRATDRDTKGGPRASVVPADH